jgi:hypothetical protein
MHNDDFKPTGEVQTFADNVKLSQTKNYIEGIDELAEKLGVEPSVDMAGITIHAKSGNNFSLTELLTAHIDMMTRTLGDNNE